MQLADAQRVLSLFAVAPPEKGWHIFSNDTFSNAVESFVDERATIATTIGLIGSDKDIFIASSVILDKGIHVSVALRVKNAGWWIRNRNLSTIALVNSIA